jgi:hypothetical protein
MWQKVEHFRDAPVSYIKVPPMNDSMIDLEAEWSCPGHIGIS